MQISLRSFFIGVGGLSVMFAGAVMFGAVSTIAGFFVAAMATLGLHAMLRFPAFRDGDASENRPLTWFEAGLLAACFLLAFFAVGIAMAPLYALEQSF